MTSHIEIVREALQLYSNAEACVETAPATKALVSFDEIEKKGKFEFDYINFLNVIADIRQKTGLGHKPMLSELADAIADKIDTSYNQGVNDALREYNTHSYDTPQQINDAVNKLVK